MEEKSCSPTERELAREQLSHFLYFLDTDVLCVCTEIHHLILCIFYFQQPSEGQNAQSVGPSRVAAVGPYIQTTPAPPLPPKQEILVKPAYPDGTATLPKPLPKPTTGESLFINILSYLWLYPYCFTNNP